MMWMCALNYDNMKEFLNTENVETEGEADVGSVIDNEMIG